MTHGRGGGEAVTHLPPQWSGTGTRNLGNIWQEDIKNIEPSVKEESLRVRIHTVKISPRFKTTVIDNAPLWGGGGGWVVQIQRKSLHLGPLSPSPIPNTAHFVSHSPSFSRTN